MIAFRVFVNGEQLCTAGIGDESVLSAIVCWARGRRSTDEQNDLDLCIGGLDTRAKKHVRWNVPELKLGDEVSIQIVESDDVDPVMREQDHEETGAQAGTAAKEQDKDED